MTARNKTRNKTKRNTIPRRQQFFVDSRREGIPGRSASGQERLNENLVGRTRYIVSGTPRTTTLLSVRKKAEPRSLSHASSGNVQLLRCNRRHVNPLEKQPRCCRSREMVCVLLRPSEKVTVSRAPLFPQRRRFSPNLDGQFHSAGEQLGAGQRRRGGRVRFAVEINRVLPGDTGIASLPSHRISPRRFQQFHSLRSTSSYANKMQFNSPRLYRQRVFFICEPNWTEVSSTRACPSWLNFVEKDQATRRNRTLRRRFSLPDRRRTFTFLSHFETKRRDAVRKWRASKILLLEIFSGH